MFWFHWQSLRMSTLSLHPRGMTWKQRCDLSSVVKSQHPTRGRPQFSTHVDRRAGSPGTFSEFKHFDGSLYPEKKIVPASERRSRSAGGLTPHHRSVSQQSEGVAVNHSGVGGETEKKPLHPYPFSVSTTPNPGFLTRGYSYSSQLSSGKKIEHEEGSQQGSAARGRTGSPAERQGSSYRRSASASSQISHEPHTHRPYRRKKESPPPPLDTNVAAILRRDLARKSKEQLQAEETERRVRTAVAVRFAMVPPQSVKGLKKTVNGHVDPNDNKHHPMVRVPHDGLRVQYYDKGRKMTTAELMGLDRHDDDSNVGDDTDGMGSHSPQPRDHTVSPARSPARASASEQRAIELDEGVALWKRLNDATDALKSIPLSYFEALRTLKSAPPQRVLFCLHLAVLMIEPHCSIVPLPAEAVWPAARDVLQPGDFVDNLIALQLEDVTMERVRVMKGMIERQETVWSTKGIEAPAADAATSSPNKQNGTADAAGNGSPTADNTPGKGSATGNSPASARRDAQQREVERRSRLDHHFIETTIPSVERQVEEQSRQASLIIRWICAFIVAHDHIVRDKKAAPPTSGSSAAS